MNIEGGSTTLRRSAARLLVTGVCLVAFLGFSMGASGATPFVTAKVAAGQRISGLLNQGFVEMVTCKRACDVTTIVSISRQDAARLGYKGSKPQVVVASSYKRLKANTRTKVIFVASAVGKKLLPKAKSRLRVVGRVTAIPRANRTATATASWNTLLK